MTTWLWGVSSRTSDGDHVYRMRGVAGRRKDAERDQQDAIEREREAGNRIVDRWIRRANLQEAADIERVVLAAMH